MTTKNRKSRCNATTKNGKACRAAATEGGLCYFHANPNKAAELGRIGGRKNGRVRDEHAVPLPTLDTALGVRETVGRLIEDLYAGKLHPKIASGLSSLLSLQLRALETSELERRVIMLENAVAEVTNPARRRGQRSSDRWVASGEAEEGSTSGETQ